MIVSPISGANFANQISGPEELCHDESRLLLGGDWNHGIFNDFPETLGNVMSSQLTNSMIFRGVGGSTTNQIFSSHLGLFWSDITAS